MPAPHNGLEVLRLEDSGLSDHLKLTERHRVLTSKWTKAELRTAEGRRLEDQVHTVERESKALCVGLACVDKLKAERG